MKTLSPRSRAVAANSFFLSVLLSNSKKNLSSSVQTLIEFPIIKVDLNIALNKEKHS